MRSVLLPIVLAVVLVVVLVSCGKSDAEITIEATREAEATADAKTTATAEADAESAQKHVERFCAFVEARFETDREMPAKLTADFSAAVDWIDYNAEPDSEVVLLLDAFIIDVGRLEDGGYVSWYDAYQKSGKDYAPDCKSSSWK